MSSATQRHAVLIDCMCITVQGTSYPDGLYLFESEAAAIAWATDLLISCGEIAKTFEGGYRPSNSLEVFSTREDAFREWQSDLEPSERFEIIPVVEVPPVAGASKTTPAIVLSEFNRVFEKRQVLTANRRRKISARLKEPEWRANWQQALDHAATLPFCNGDNSRYWHADIDWFIRPDTVAKLIEGRYDDAHTYGDSGAAAKEQRNADAFAAFEQSIGIGSKRRIAGDS